MLHNFNIVNIRHLMLLLLIMMKMFLIKYVEIILQNFPSSQTVAFTRPRSDSDSQPRRCQNGFGKANGSVKDSQSVPEDGLFLPVYPQQADVGEDDFEVWTDVEFIAHFFTQQLQFKH